MPPNAYMHALLITPQCAAGSIPGRSRLVQLVMPHLHVDAHGWRAILRTRVHQAPHACNPGMEGHRRRAHDRDGVMQGQMTDQRARQSCCRCVPVLSETCTYRESRPAGCPASGVESLRGCLA